ncbi:phage protein NinX family protein [Paraburkholderia domus]|uniref:phage protein NinX family protein n=1 Tax=Paraburkholderia domus TaxID=2793075 RepID=UPI0019141FDD|nr:phage protein NinX family protein [Paraburkholderia domus]MBK5064830.1 DUF2591 family protein [Burkholderia sp. R-70199]CAE6967383.1 hypothetical protein R70199_07839 [Paraburkholderia domus]
MIRTKELTAHQLDAWVALCDGERIATQYPPDQSGRFWLTPGAFGTVKECPRFSTDWSAGGPIAHRELISYTLMPLNYIISIRCTACGETIRTTVNQSPTDKDRIAAACAAGWGLALHDDTLVFICTGPSCATQALTRKRTLRSRGFPSHRTSTVGEPE